MYYIYMYILLYMYISLLVRCFRQPVWPQALADVLGIHFNIQSEAHTHYTLHITHTPRGIFDDDIHMRYRKFQY